MPGIREGVFAPARCAWVIAFLGPVAMAGILVVKSYNMRRPDQVESKNHLHIPTGLTDARDGVLFTMRVSGSALQVEQKQLTPVTREGMPVAYLERSQIALVGRYFYRLTYTAEQLKWEMVGVRLRLGDSVGRNPLFAKTSALTYEPKPGKGHEIPFWMDGMPTWVFTLQPKKNCKADGSAICLEMHGPSGRMTVERDRAPEEFHHVQAGELLAMQPVDRLWIANLPYQLLPVSDSGQVDLLLADRYETLRGNRALLGPPGLNGVARLHGETSFVAEDITAEYHENHLANQRWEPQTEDEMQLLVDSGLLCLHYVQEGKKVVPRLDWSDLATGNCPDPLRLGPQQNVNSVTQAVLDIYLRRRGDDDMIRRANAALSDLSSTTPRDNAFEFEWWPVRLDSTAPPVKLPVRVWGPRTGATMRTLNAVSEPAPGASAPSDPFNDALVLRGRNGSEKILARTVSGERVYGDGTTDDRKDLIGLGPLLGIRDKVDGLDSIRLKAPNNGRGITLTIDPDLQPHLWESLKKELDGIERKNFNESVDFGVSGVAMDAENGNILSVLNWPAALNWEDRGAFQRLGEEASWGVPRTSMNEAMLRADKVGSVFKLLSIYTMADMGILDGESGRPGDNCGRLHFGIMETHHGRVGPMKTRLFTDHQAGPMPVGPGGLLGSLNEATATSCNTYFTLAAAMLLEPNPPELVELKSCPIDGSRRTDKPANKQWLLCTTFRDGEKVRLLLLPEGESLADRARAPFTGPGVHGYFERALQAGFRMGYNDPNGAMQWRAKTSYEGFLYRSDWMPGLRGAEGRVFFYPMMYSPLSHFGGGQEKFGGAAQQVPRGLTWRDFASQAIGEAGQGSALTVAALYSAVGREDGAIPAPRLIVSDDPVSTRQIFDPRENRTARIREALKQPLYATNGTAQKLGKFLRENGIGGVVGKTGTFDIEALGGGQEESEEQREVRMEDCGVISSAQLTLDRPPSARFLGSRSCESYMTTGVQRYPEFAPSGGPRQSAGKKRGGKNVETITHTSFAGVVTRPGRHSVVIVVIADLDEKKDKVFAKDLIEPLLKDLGDWMK